GNNFTFRAITRLVRDTSGVVLIAKNPLSAANLSDDMKSGRIKKEYAAVTCGVPNPPKGRIDAPIKRLRESVILRCVSADGKEAVTDYETISVSGGLSLVRLYPLTGRTHQLRVHLSHIGTPIYGDDLYGAPQKNESTRLHCRKITFIHPHTKSETVLEAPLPQDMTDLINK
ncbi:MAG: RluA family pseudouridine synthase, partial [Clostridia bacterium]|nr:RluA family pseudouridine synthase [Clostridia bacterium]